MDLELLNNLVGSKYVENGRGTDGYDCYGLVLRLGELYNVPLPFPVYGSDYHSRNDVANDYRHSFEKVDFPVFGDIIAIRIGKYVTHVGWMIDNYRFLHTTEKTGTVITRVDSPKYANRIEGYYRCKMR